MKKTALVLAAATGVALTVFAACTDNVINSSSDNASQQPGCTNDNSNADCAYSIFTPAKPECTGGGGGICLTTGTNITIVSQEYEGVCNGSGGCHNGNPDNTPPTTNTVATLTLGTCGGQP